ncbi:chymotrypsin-like elastase family member 2A [Paramacrobiotus metropolitanus]|uniref:chymotrypsin-like elastase family member 2A n=1 Tax=Paramacrobiotus metropolitanus TaxID=2943436 RepID=UPI0024456D64|nr:chymotrypsin-like elastase family member 2A [Paramacrobiotus metropolitanus]
MALGPAHPADHQHIASGLVLRKNEVLTNGHVCASFTSTYSHRKCVFGKHNLTEYEDGQLEINVTGYHCHEDFNYILYEHDLCVITLENNIPGFNDRIQPLKLMSRFEAFFVRHDQCKIYGWGNSNEFPDTFTPVLQVGSTKIARTAACKAQIPAIQDDQMCARSDGAFAEHADSGTPIICNTWFFGKRIVGIEFRQYV